LFFERFREAVARLPAGLIRPEPPATPAQIAAVEANLARSLPAPIVSFLRSFDGADLFHKAVVIAGAGAGSGLRLVDVNRNVRDLVSVRPDDVVFAEVLGGDVYACGADGRILRLRSDSDERWFAGGDFSRWLDGLVAHQRVLYGPDGEFLPEAFEPDGHEVIPLVALRQAERALRLCDDSAEWHHERGVALRRLGRLADAKSAFARAAAVDPENPWPLFDLGRAGLAMGSATAREAGAAFEAAAGLDRGESSARLWIWAARAALLEAAVERLASCRREAVAREPAIGVALRRARDAAVLDGDPGEISEAQALLDALEDGAPNARLRLPVLVDAAVSATPKVTAAATPARRTPRPDPRRPARSTQPRSAGPRGGRRG
jgi:Tetratricopeptide repeat